MVAELHLPESFRQRLLAGAPAGVRNDRARWLSELPDVLATLSDRWDLRIGELYPLSRSYVAAAERESGEACVLKIGPPVPDGGAGAVREAHALRIAGPSAVRVMEADAESGALLLERASGVSLEAMSERDDDAATEILANAIRGFAAPAGAESGLPPLSTLEDSFEEFDRGPHGASFRGKDLTATLAEIDTGLRDLRAASATARRVLEELLADGAPPVVIHGDLHHGNLLEDDARGWVAIDPKGFFGDAGYEVGAMLYNPRPYPARLDDVDHVVGRRLAIMAGIVGMDRDKMAAWGYVKAALSLIWSLEDGGELHRDDVRMHSLAALRKMI